MSEQPPKPDGAAPASNGGATHAADDAERVAVRAAQEASLRLFGWLIVASGAALLAFGAWWGGVDFAAAVLLGFLIVLLNFYWTKRAVKSVLFSDQPRSLLTLSFLVKFGVTGAVLFYAILRLKVDAVGILVGLSSLALAAALFTLRTGGGR